MPSDLSDHNALHFSIQCLNPPDKECDNSHAQELFKEWNEGKVDYFRSHLLENINRLDDVTVNLNKNTINHSMNLFTLCMQNSAYAVFGKQRKSKD